MRRPQQLGSGPSLETPSRLLASAHPGLPASTDIAKEACSPTPTGGWIGGAQVSDVQADSRFPRWETRAKGRGFLASAAYTDIMALWDTQPGSSVCSSPNLLPRTRIQVQVSSAEMIPVNPRRGMRDWDKAERQSTNDRSSSQSANGDQACWETPGATAECVPQSNPTEAEGAGWVFI